MFKLNSKFKPTGDQPEAIAKLTQGLKSGKQHQTLLGVTGSGKTFTMANVIANYGKPTLVISHNKTLAAQLYKELKEFFPKNAVHYFVSYYDYYQPEAYIPHTNTYIEKDSKINEEIDRLRHAATQALMSRDDVIIVASVSCIYNLGDPDDYKNLGLHIFENKKIKPDELVHNLLRLQYAQDIELRRGAFRKSAKEIEIVNPGGQEVIKIKFGNPLFGPKDKIGNLYKAVLNDQDELQNSELKYGKIVETTVFPAKYWIASDDKIGIAIENIKSEFQKHVKKLKAEGKENEATRLKERTLSDIEMMRQTGYCHGIENYSMHLDFRKPGDPPYTLIDFFKSKGEFLTIVDESHISMPQLRSMYNGDHARKKTLVEYGFRLPSAIDNRPLKFPEFNQRIQKVIYVSATPAKYELEKSGKKGIAEQLLRPTGLLDPTIEIVPSENQISDLVARIKERTAHGERVIVTTITKRMAEDLSDFLTGEGIKVSYLHSEIKTLDRLKILRDLRLGHQDVIVGVNLLREGLDLPEVSLIAILDADKEGFLRNSTTLIQTMGRAARHINGHVVMYADKITRSIDHAMKETVRRRKTQEQYNAARNITPVSIQKSISEFDLPVSRTAKNEYIMDENLLSAKTLSFSDSRKRMAVKQLEKMMQKAVKQLDYEKALIYREQIRQLKE